MNAVTKILSRVLGKIPARGTIVTPSGVETYPTAICNEIMGGPFIVDSIEEMKEIPIQRMLKGCKCTVNEHTLGGVITPTTTYMLKSVPTIPGIERLSELSEVNISEYWILDRPQQQEESAIEYQYAPNYLGKKPLFMSANISREAYNAGYPTTETYTSGDTGNIIWVSDYDVNTHVWVRQRTGSLADWGIPVKIDEGYEDGSYNDVRFQWVLKSIGKPARPESMINGTPNNDPEGWLDVPTVPEGEDYANYIETYNLWKINAIKGVYGDLISEWSDPVMISTNPELVRYGVIASNKEYFNDLYWRGYYSIGDKYKASRATLDDDWIVEAISGESGEYIDYVFKEFSNSYEPVLADAPQTILGYGTNDWQDGAFTTTDGFTLYVSTSRKYSDGSFSTPWSIPVRFDGKDTIRTVVTPIDNLGTIFKYVYDGGIKVVTPTSLKFEAKIYKGNVEIPSSNVTKVEWYRGTYESGSLIPKLLIGSEPNRNIQISGTNDTVLEIFPENIDNEQTFTARVFLLEEDYFDSISVLDATDGVGYVINIGSTEGFTYTKTTLETRTFIGSVYENGIDISGNTIINYKWYLGTTLKSETKQTTVSNTEFVGISTLKLEVTIGDLVLTRTENLTDIGDGKSIERQYSPFEVLSSSSTPDNFPNEWSTTATNAVWAIERVTGESWGVAFRIKGEKGTPNGAFQKTVFKTVAEGGTIPGRPTARTGASSTLVPQDWMDEPDSSAATGSTVYGSKATFMKNPSTESIDEIVGNWNISGQWSLPFKVTYFPEAGTNGASGTDGNNGWTPVISIETNSDKAYQKVIDYTGGTGTKPTLLGYVGTTGITTAITTNTINVKGAQGIQGVAGPTGIASISDFWETTVSTLYSVTGSGLPTLNVTLYRQKSGLVHFSGTIIFPSGTDGWKTVDFNPDGDTGRYKYVPIGLNVSGLSMVGTTNVFRAFAVIPGIYVDSNGVCKDSQNLTIHVETTSTGAIVANPRMKISYWARGFYRGQFNGVYSTFYPK